MGWTPGSEDGLHTQIQETRWLLLCSPSTSHQKQSHLHHSASSSSYLALTDVMGSDSRLLRRVVCVLPSAPQSHTHTHTSFSAGLGRARQRVLWMDG